MPLLPYARAPRTVGSNPIPLQAVSDRDENATIQPGEDFTIQLTHISKSIFDKYGRDPMLAFDHDNDFFVVMSQFGIGGQGKSTSSTVIHCVREHKSIDRDIADMPNEVIRWIEDYRHHGDDGNAGHIYLKVSTFCQDLEGANESDMDNIKNAVISLVGRFVPSLGPLLSVVGKAVNGIGNIIDKFQNKKAELKSVEISLWPRDASHFHGNHCLQEGSYVLFFEDTEITDFHLTPHGSVERQSSQASERALTSPFRDSDAPPPYVVINVMRGLIAGADPGKLNKAAAVDVLEKYDERYGLNGARQGVGAARSNPSISLGLDKLGDAYRLKKQIQRYTELKLKEKSGHLLPSEKQRLTKIISTLQAALPDVSLD